MSIPNLSSLTINPSSQLKKDTETGIYTLDNHETIKLCDRAYIMLIRNALPAGDEDIMQAQQFMNNDINDDTFMGKRVPRKQCTFGPVQYKKYQLVNDEKRTFQGSTQPYL